MMDRKIPSLYITEEDQLWKVLEFSNRTMYPRIRVLFPRELGRKVSKVLQEIIAASAYAPVQILGIEAQKRAMNRSPQEIELITAVPMSLPAYSAVRCMAGAVSDRILQKASAPADQLRWLYHWCWGKAESPLGFSGEMAAGILREGEAMARFLLLVLQVLGIPAVIRRGRKQAAGRWESSSWNEVYLQDRWVPVDFLEEQCSAPGFSVWERYGRQFREDHDWKTSASDTIDRAEYALVARQLRDSSIRGTGSFHFCTMDDVRIEVPVRLRAPEQDPQSWNLLWISALLGGGFLPADERGKGLAILGNHCCSISYENSRDIAYSGWISGELLHTLPLTFEQENGVTTIAVS